MKPQIMSICKLVLALLLVTMMVGSIDAQTEDDLPLSEPGPYAVGTRDMTFIDENRDAQEIDVTVWYPAVEEAQDAPPDLSDAPYPVIVYSHGRGDIANRRELAPLVSHLVSYGFVVAAPTHNWEARSQTIAHRPMDVLFVIDQLGDVNDDLSGVLDLGQIGVMGYSMGATTALQMGGARPDREYYNAYCAEHLQDTLFCLLASDLEQADVINAQFATMDENGLWYVPTNPNIHAVAAMAPCFGPIFGERGLAAADMPVLIMAGTADEVCLYERDAVFMFNYLGAEHRYLISFVNGMHRFGYDTRTANPRINHFMVAFFGYYLQGREDYAQYLAEDYVNGIHGLAWGPYSDDVEMLNLAPITPDNVAQIQELAAFEQDTVCTATFSPDGELLASSGVGAVNLLDSSDGAVIRTLPTRHRRVTRIAFSPAGSLLAAISGSSTCGQGVVQVWDMDSGELRLQLLDEFGHDPQP